MLLLHTRSNVHRVMLYNRVRWSFVYWNISSFKHSITSITAMKYCSVYSCETNNLCKKTFLHIVRKEWISLVKWKTLKPNLICNSHFEKTFYNGKRLKDNAVPTIFHKLTSIILKEHDYCLPSADMTRKQE